MLVGSAAIEVLASGAAEVVRFNPEPIEISEVACFQMTAEMRNSARESQLPSALHPTIPAALSVQVYEIGESPWGAFQLATVRVSCRSGVRARGFTRAAIASSQAACAGLRAELGFPARVGQIRFRHGYDGVSILVAEDSGQPILGVEALDPEPMAVDDIQYTGTLNLAHTPLGLRLMQVEMASSTSRVERLSARLTAFDGSAWGDELLDPVRVIASSVASMDASFPPIRFVCKPDELAFTGTESVAAFTGTESVAAGAASDT